MQFLKQTFIILNLILLVFSFQDTSDINHLSLFMRENDKLRVNLRKMMSFYSTSINFSCNNPHAILPGIPKLNPISFGDIKQYTPVILKSKNNHIFIVETDRSTVSCFYLNGNQPPTRYDTKFSFLNNKAYIFDLHLDDSRLTFLYMNPDDPINQLRDPTQVKYSLYSINYLAHTNEAIAHFVIGALGTPTLKQLSPTTGPNEMSLVFLIFDKEMNTGNVYSTQKEFLLLSVDFVIAEQILNSQNLKFFKINPLLFKQKKEDLLLKNIMISSAQRHQIFFFTQFQTNANSNRNNVHSCLIDFSHDLDTINFKECGLFIDQPVKQFFLKNTHYLYIDIFNKVQFCSVDGKQVKEGALQESWEMKSVLMEDSFAVLIMAIDNSKFIFINDFKDNSLTWVHDNSSPFVPSYLLTTYVRQDKHIFLAEVPSSGLALKDITLNTFFEVHESHLGTDQLTNLYLDDKIILSYDLRSSEGVDVQNLQKDREIEVLVAPESKKFRTKLDIQGSNLQFTDLGSAKVDFFSPMTVTFLAENDILAGQFNYFHQNLKFYSDWVVPFECAVKKELYQYECIRQEPVKLSRTISPKAIHSVEELGDILVLKSLRSDDFVFFDKENLKLLDFIVPKNFLSGSKCMAFQYFVACAYTLPEQPSIDTIRLFKITPKSLIELPSFEISIINSLNKIIKELLIESKTVTKISIVDFDFDNVQTHKLSVLYFIEIDKQTPETAYLNYDFSFNPNNAEDQSVLLFINRSTDFELNGHINQKSNMVIFDSQTIFWEFSPGFKLFCFDEDSEYHFAQISVAKIIKTILLNNYSMIIFIYEDLNKLIYFAVFKITQNATKQLIRNEKIDFYDENWVLSVVSIDDRTLGFYQYNPIRKEVYASYMYFRNGPLLVSDSFLQKLTVNGNYLELKFVQDKFYDLKRNKMVKSSKIQISPIDKQLSIPLKSFFQFQGNLKDIDLALLKVPVGVTLEKPLTPSLSTDFHQFTAIGSPANSFFQAFPDYFLIQEDRSVPAFILVSRTEKQQKPDTYNFELNGASCNKVLLSALSILCFWTDGVFPKVTIRSLTTFTKPPETITLPETMSDIRILADNSSILQLLFKDVYGKYLCISTFDRNSKKTKNSFIGKKEMSVDDLNILDFFHDHDLKNKILTIIFLDAHSNQLLFYHRNTDLVTRYFILKRNVYLNDLDSAIEKLNCIKASASNNIYSCFLISASHIYNLKVQKNTEPEVSKFKWEVKLIKSLYNVLGRVSQDNQINLQALTDKNSVYLFEQNINTAVSKQLIHYDLTLRQNLYSSFSFDLTPYPDILSIDYNSENDINIFYLQNNMLKRVKLNFGSYTLHIEDQIKLDHVDLTLNSRFLGQTDSVDFKFSFAQNGPPVEDIVKKRNVWLALLICGIIIMSVLILLSIIAIAVLLRDKKKAFLTQNQAVDETEIDISYM